MTVGAWKVWVERTNKIWASTEASVPVADTTSLFLTQDSRELRTAKPGACGFIAIAGNWHDGHAFLEDAHANGARYFIVNENAALPDLPESDVVRCPDPVAAWQGLTREWRDACGTPIIAITGSNGKTTVKEWLLQLIAPHTIAFGSPRSYNSQVGVPLAMRELDSEHQLGIIEAGISQPGEMIRLEQCIGPSAGVLTHLGDAHLDNFADRAALMEEKLALFKGCDWVAMPGYLSEAAGTLRSQGQHVYTWGPHSDDALKVTSLVRDEGRVVSASYAGQDATWFLPFASEIGYRNAMSAALVSLIWGVAFEEVGPALRRFRDLEHRMQRIRKTDGMWVLSDAYTNDWEALELAVNDLHLIPGKAPKAAIIGPVPGMQSDGINRLRTLLEANEVDVVWAVGNGWKSPSSPSNWEHFPTAEEALDNLHANRDAFKGCHVLVKGPRAERFERLTDALVMQGHATRVILDTNALTSNLQSIRSFIRSHCPTGTDLIGVIKAGGYGTHAAAVARVLQFHRVPIVAVACTEEGVELRQHGITCRILVLNPTPDTFGALIRYRLEPTVHAPEQFDALTAALASQEAPWPVHIKVDTGMHRLGFAPNDSPELRRVALHPRVDVKTVFSHVASADRPAQDDATRLQFAAFNRAVATVQEVCPEAKSHVLNSAGMVRFPEEAGGYVRTGIALLGAAPVDSNSLELQPAVHFETAVTSLHHIPPNQGVGYGLEDAVAHERVLATLPVGYADGYPRSLSNGLGHVIIRGCEARVVGKVCMDMTMVDVTSIAGVAVGDHVELFGRQLPIERVASAAGTIAYEILSRIPMRVLREQRGS